MKREMVVVSLYGGLGNQMFQYAAGLAVALRNRFLLKLDVTALEQCQPPRHYSLNHFNIFESFATMDEIQSLRFPYGQKISKSVFNLPYHVLPQHFRSYVQEHNYRYDSSVLKINRSVYLDGYWQTEKYFYEFREQIRTHFVFKTQFSPITQEISKIIEQQQSVSIHVRRKDYVTNPGTNLIHGCCSLEYYQKAIAFIKEKIEHPKFFIFSDDPVWARENIETGCEMVVVDHNDEMHDYEDLHLLSLCKHHIIANSTFSWWGAWLSKNSDKVVIAPLNWFNVSNNDTSDLIPDGWIRL